MAQATDYELANQSGASFRSELNTILAAIASANSGATEPTTTYPYMLWADTSSGFLKQRNAANDAWITLYDLATAQAAAIADNTVTTAKITDANVTNAKLAADVFSTAHTWSAAQSFTADTLVKSANGLGYGAGAGGTVTQATSKSTSVTLNKPTGTITTSNSALAAGARIAFSVNNSLFTTNDLVIVNIVGSANYLVQPYFNGSGAFNVAIENISAGSLSEALTIKFAIIKGATS